MLIATIKVSTVNVIIDFPEALQILIYFRVPRLFEVFKKSHSKWKFYDENAKSELMDYM